MKRNYWFLISVTLNVALAGALFLRHSADRVKQRPGNSSAPATAVVSAPSVPDRNPTPQKSKNWVETLRAAEIPEALITKVAVADFEANWQQRRDELQRQFEKGDIDGSAMKRFYLKHDAEEENALRLALGDDGFRRWDKTRLLRDYKVAGMNLSDKETEDLYALRKDAAQQRHALALAVLNGDIDEPTLEKQTEEAQKQFEEKTKVVLGEERYALISGGDSAQGDLKRALASLNPTVSQSEAVLQAEQQWSQQQATIEKQLHDGAISSAEYQQQMQALNAARDDEYRKQLGTNGFAELQKAQDNRYRLMQHYASAWNLDAPAIDNLYASIQYYENSSRDYLQQARALQDQGKAVDWSGVQAELQQYSLATEDAFRKSLGNERFNQLKRNHVLTFEE